MKTIKKLFLPTSLLLAITPLSVTLSSCKDNSATYTISFVNEAEKMEPIKVKRGEKLPVPTITTKPGQAYILDGWYEDEKYTYKYDFNTPVCQNMTLYAKWVLYDGRVTKDEWNSAISYLLTQNENRHFSLKTETILQAYFRHNKLVVDGYNELVYDVTDPAHTCWWAFSCKEKPWVDTYTYVNGSSKPIAKGFGKTVFSEQYKNLNSPSADYQAFFQILTLSQENQPYAYDKFAWTYDKDAKYYFTTIHSGYIWYDVSIKFNLDKKIEQFWCHGQPAIGEYEAYTFLTIDYDRVPVTVPEGEQQKQKVMAWSKYDESVPQGFTVSQPLPIDFDSPTCTVNIKNTTANPIKYKIVVNTTYPDEIYYPDDDILTYTGTIAANTTEPLVIDYTTTTSEYWSKIKFMGMDVNLKISVIA